jgi:hypothetical protein
VISNVTVGSGLTAFQNASTRMDQSADQIAKASVGVKLEGKSSDLVSPVVKLQGAALDARAAIKLIDVEDKTKGYLIDVLA